jgi:hypothetical protein
MKIAKKRQDPVTIEWVKPKQNRYVQAFEEAFWIEYRKSPIFVILGSVAVLAAIIQLTAKFLVWLF